MLYIYHVNSKKRLSQARSIIKIIIFPKQRIYLILDVLLLEISVRKCRKSEKFNCYTAIEPLWLDLAYTSFNNKLYLCTEFLLPNSNCLLT